MQDSAQDFLSKIKVRVQRGEISPMGAFDRIVSASNAGANVEPLMQWIERRLDQCRKRGENPYLRRRGGQVR